MGKYIFHPNQINELKDNYDVIIVGSGATGLVAALQAHELGLHPVVLEKMPRLGGNSTRASSGMNASETDVQLQHHIVDSYADFYQDTWKGGHQKNQPDLLNYFTSHAALAIDWLAQHQIELTDLTITGGMHTKRTHRPGNGAPVGAYLVTECLKQIEAANIPVFNNARVQAIDKNNQRITGVIVKIGDQVRTIKTTAVLLATGGFSANHELVKRYRPELAHYRTTNQSGATGDGLKLATDIGAGLTDIKQIQVHPTVQQDSDHAFLIPEAIRGEGAILVNQNGQRFTNELATRDDVTDAINQQPSKSAYLLLDQNIYKRIPAMKFYQAMKLVVSASTVVELAKQLQIPSEELSKTIDSWNQAVTNHDDLAFGRTTGMNSHIEQVPYYAIHVAPALHYTMGGLKVNARTEVLTTVGKVINGLFAGGEVAGGLHGYNRIGGNSIAETVVFGRRAAQSVFQYLQAQGDDEK